MEIRKIESEETREKKSKRNVLILSMVMIAILVFSTAGYFSMREDEENGENNGLQFNLANSLKETENVSILMFKTINDYSGKMVYVSSDYSGGLSELSLALRDYAERIQEACYGECDQNLPEKDCNETMIVISNSNESKVYEEENCVFIQGDLRAVDAFIYKLFDIK